MTELSAISRLSNDFLEFDGNPQGIRIVTRLQGRTAKERQERGMNLTFSQVLTGLKYLRSPSEPKEHGSGKPGFFESEADRVMQARNELGVAKKRRFPTSYIVEAADDIAYCLSDIEDGIEHNILSAADFFRAVNREVPQLHRAGLRKLLETSKNSFRRLNRTRDSGRNDSGRNEFFEFKTRFTPILIESAARLYRQRHQTIMDGDLLNLFERNEEESILLDALKRIAGKFLYSSSSVEQPLRLGLKVVSGILDHLGCLLRISRSDFDELIKARLTGDRHEVKAKKSDRELLLYDMLPKAYFQIYEYERARPRIAKPLEWEWFCRAHLILDYLSGMTDDFALRTYHGLAGIAG
jgi:dGTPase